MTGFRREMKAWKLRKARVARINPTPAERVLWSHLRKHQLHGLRFRRQALMLGFIVDFYCPSVKLVVEVDGWSHQGREYSDCRRTMVLEEGGFRIVRVSNEAVLTNIETALEHIYIAAMR